VRIPSKREGLRGEGTRRKRSTRRKIKKDRNLMIARSRDQETRNSARDPDLQGGIVPRKEGPSSINGMPTSTSDLPIHNILNNHPFILYFKRTPPQLLYHAL
jgi:hypothetical protein